MNPTANYYLVLRLRMCGAILPLPHIPSWQSCLIKFLEKFAVVVVDDDGERAHFKYLFCVH
jgi:hypothetical protein